MQEAIMARKSTADLCRQVSAAAQEYSRLEQQVQQRGPAVLQYLQNNGLSFREIARRCDCSVTFISQVANKKSKCTVNLFCKIAGLEVSTLDGGSR
jgi:hypothetical protein